MRKRRIGRPRKVGRPRRRGGNVLSAIRSGLSKANNFLRGTKAISRISGALGSVGVPYASQVSGLASSLGYGRRRYRVRNRRRRY